MVHQNQATGLCLELVAELDVTPVVIVLATRRMQELHCQGALHQGSRKKTSKWITSGNVLQGQTPSKETEGSSWVLSDTVGCRICQEH